MPDERETALNEAYQARYGVAGPYADRAIIKEGQAAHYFFDAGVAFGESSREAAEAERDEAQSGNAEDFGGLVEHEAKRAEAAEAEVERLREALRELVRFGDNFLLVPDSEIDAYDAAWGAARAALSPREDADGA